MGKIFVLKTDVNNALEFLSDEQIAFSFPQVSSPSQRSSNSTKPGSPQRQRKTFSQVSLLVTFLLVVSMSPVSPDLFPFRPSFLLGAGALSHFNITTVPWPRPYSFCICLFHPALRYRSLVYINFIYLSSIALPRNAHWHHSLILSYHLFHQYILQPLLYGTALLSPRIVITQTSYQLPQSTCFKFQTFLLVPLVESTAATQLFFSVFPSPLSFQFSDSFPRIEPIPGNLHARCLSFDSFRYDHTATKTILFNVILPATLGTFSLTSDVTCH